MNKECLTKHKKRIINASSMKNILWDEGIRDEVIHFNVFPYGPSEAASAYL